MKRTVLKSIACAVLVLAGCHQAFADPGLTVGDKAPELDVGEWISLGKNRFKQVSKFEPGKVYVVEFWATWCGPCIAMMPDIAKLQEKYVDQGLQFVSLSDELREDIDSLRKKEVPDAKGEDKTFADIMSHYTVGSDTDGSVKEQYMGATRQDAIPYSFIVGKDGLLEWAGHPGDIEEPLQAVIQDKWDRNSFKIEFDGQQSLKDLDEELQEAARKLKPIERDAKFSSVAIPIIEKYESIIKSETVLQDLSFTKLDILIKGDLQGDKTTALFKSIMKNEKVSSVTRHELAWKAYEVSIERAMINQELLQAAIDAIPSILQKVSESSRPTVLDTLAHLQHRVGDNKAALATAEEAYKLSKEAPEYLAFVKQLKEELK